MRPRTANRKSIHKGVDMKASRLNNLDDDKTKEQLLAEVKSLRSVIGMLSVAADDSPGPAIRRTSPDQGLELIAARKGWTEAERIGRVKDDFLANLFHELRTPIAAILGWSRLLTPDNSTPDDLARGLDAIQRNAHVQARLIDDLLDMSRIISGKMRLDLQQLELPAIIDAAIESVSLVARAKNIHIEKISDPFAAPVFGDPNRLQQVVWNLLLNAVKFTPPGGKVLVALEYVNSHMQISVSDDGQGISPDFLPHVFERLSQEASSARKMQTGLGLGLAIVKSLVELHDGSVDVTSPGEGKGATFTITLPISPAAALRINPSRPHPSPSAPLMSMRLETVHVMIIDDDATALEGVRQILQNCKARVTTATSADQALQLLRREPPDVVLTDLELSQTDGHEFLRQIRALPSDQGRDVPVAAFTTFARSEDRRQALLAGFDMCLAKPAEPTELVDVISRLTWRT
jgi:signal transduction histidine kinase/CheY-like chemotaxis protein